MGLRLCRNVHHIHSLYRFYAFLWKLSLWLGCHGNLGFPLTYNGENWKTEFIAKQLQIYWQNFYRNNFWKVLFQPYIFGPLLVCTGCNGNHNAKKKKWKKKILKNISPQKPYTLWNWDFIEIFIRIISLYRFCVIYENQLSSLVTMATWSFYTLIMGRIENGIYCQAIADVLTKLCINIPWEVFYEPCVCFHPFFGVTSLW